MESLTSNQVALIGTAAVLVSAFIASLLGGVGFLIKRKMTGSPKHERATYLNTVAELLAKLRTHGMTIDDVRNLEAVMQNPSVSSSNAAIGVVGDLIRDADEPEAFQSNMAMKMRAGAAYDVAEAKLGQALMDMRLILSEEEWERVERAQGHWNAYRGALEDFALCEYAGGTHAPLAMSLVGLAETERRADEIRAQIEERSDR